MSNDINFSGTTVRAVSNTLINNSISAFADITINPDKVVVQGSSLTDIVKELENRLNLLESNMKALPAIIGEVLVNAFNSVYSGEIAPVFIPSSTGSYSCNINAGNNIYAGSVSGVTTGQAVDLSPAISAIVCGVTSAINSNINFDELNKLRARVRELEEDLGYREKVAVTLMQEYKI